MSPALRLLIALWAGLMIVSTAGMVLAVARMDARVVAHQTLPLEAKDE